ncbi:hypothetical protein PAGU2638_20730 [Lysobacter sp. PAGU 2638]
MRDSAPVRSRLEPLRSATLEFEQREPRRQAPDRRNGGDGTAGRLEAACGGDQHRGEYGEQGEAAAKAT